MAKTPIATLGIDLGKNSCSLAGMDASGSVVLRKRMTREGLIKFTGELPACVVAMEACCGAHYLGRTFETQGHTVRLMSPEYVAPYVKAQKTDDRDAEAIAEAATRPTMRLVTLKTEAQLDLQVLHRARERLVAGRTRLTNQLRAVLIERGVILPKRRSCLAKRLDEMMKDKELAVSPRALRLVQDLLEEWASLDRRIGAYNDELAALTREDDMARRLATIPGIGTINATALVAAVGDASAFAKGRDLAAWLGLTPRQHSTGGKTRLMGISKRGNKYLRTQLIHGARAALAHFTKKPTPVGAWVSRMLTRAHPNVVVVALAAKLARIVWAVLRHGRDYQHGPAVA
ncbi:IS110 family transposase [Sphingomonas sp. RHCKR7]|uniref:IS110 family transposase n=1 Tax=Sphingomonas folli TaxID=2862497 RepID=UPI001CA5007D|nr:IS110 family transposase [Sphingomonas folli]MBW6525231.1 IS110 family transposase [Sphingomonas folli]